MNDFWQPLLGTVWEVRLESCYPHPIAEVIHVDGDRLLFRSEGRLRSWWAYAGTVMDPLAGYHYIGTVEGLAWIKQDALIIHRTSPTEDVVVPFVLTDEPVPPMAWEVLGWDWPSGRVIFRTYGWRNTEFFTRETIRVQEDFRNYTMEVGPRWGSTLLHVSKHYRPATEEEWRGRSEYIDRLRTRVDPTWNQPYAPPEIDLFQELPISVLAIPRANAEPVAEVSVEPVPEPEEPMSYEMLND